MKGRDPVGKTKSSALFAVALAVALLVVPLAFAAETTREAYTEAVEPICKANTKANERILKGVRGKVKAGQLDAAAAQFSKAASALRKTIVQLKAVPQPTADEAKLGKWLKYVEEEATLFQKTAKKLKADDKVGAQRMVIQLTRNANQANNQVLGFEFTYCRFEPSKFT